MDILSYILKKLLLILLSCETIVILQSPYSLDKCVLQVETFGAMAKTEKIAFILEQVCDLSCIHLSVKSVLL